MEEYTRERAAEWLNKHWQGPKICPICQSNNWVFSESLVEIRPYHGGQIFVGGTLYPLFLLICGVCGYTVLFNAIVAGLISPTPAKEEKIDAPAVEKKES